MWMRRLARKQEQRYIIAGQQVAIHLLLSRPSISATAFFKVGASELHSCCMPLGHPQRRLLLYKLDLGVLGSEAAAWLRMNALTRSDLAESSTLARY